MRRRQQGFSLLEMIAALTILAIGSVVLFSWLGQTMSQLSRFQDAEKASLARLQAVQYLSTQNPFAAPTGKQTFETFSMEWKSEPAREARISVSPAGGLGLYQIGLYDVQVAIFYHTGRPWFSFSLKLAGYRQDRKPARSTPF